MAYVSVERASSVGPVPRINAPGLTWSRLGAIALALAIWVGLAFAIRALF